jgi:hypothetical protein
MKALTLALLLSLQLSPPPRPVPKPVSPLTQVARKGGKWYFAATGHAVYCYGPVLVVNQVNGGLQRVATFCQGDQPIVPLRD